MPLFRIGFSLRLIIKSHILLLLITLFFGWHIAAVAEIIPITEIKQIVPQVEQEALVLFNIAEVLTDSSMSLGCSAWRKYLKKNGEKWNEAFR